MARAAFDDGIETIVATPHVNHRYGADTARIGAGVEDLRAALTRAEVPISVLGGAEVALGRLPGLDWDEVRTLCLGHSSYLLVESPYSAVGSLMEESVFDLLVHGFHPLLAHPERCPEFQRDVGRLETLVDRGVMCSISAGSIVGQFGDTVRRFAGRLLDRGLVHNVSSDAHDPVHRAPELRQAFRGPKSPFRDTLLQLWLTSAVPAAILADEPPPPRPQIASPSRWQRVVRR